ncbi:MAG: alpha/beta fold hydrolase [Marmoricola sp.]
MNALQRLTSYTNHGLVFDVLDEGPLDGPVVVLLHGFPQRATSWAKVTPLLHAEGFRTVAPDQRGYSPVARPRGRRAYRMGNLVGDVAALVDALGGRPVHVVGHDWGAAVAWSLASVRPDLVSTMTTVSVPHPGAMVRSFRSFDQLRRSWYLVFFQIPWLPELLLRRRRLAERAFGRAGMGPDALARYGAEMIEDGALRGGLGWYRAMPFSDPALLRAKVRVPTTHVWSDQDDALGRLGADLSASYVVGAPYRLEVLKGVTHWIPDEAPDRLAEITLARIRSV